MSEYEYDKNKPGQRAGAGNDPVSGDAGSGMNSPGGSAAGQNRSSGSDSAWENDDWSMRSSSGSDDDDPLIKLARLMEQNERNFEAAAQRSNDSVAAAPQDTYSPETVSVSQDPAPQAYHPEPSVAESAQSPEPIYQHAPQDPGYMPADEPSVPRDDPYASSGTLVADAPAPARPPSYDEHADDEQYDPFAPGGSSQPLPDRDFDVSRIPRAIRPAASVDHSQMGGLHGSASPDQAEPESRPEPVAAQRAQDAPRNPATSPSEPIAPQPDPIAAELLRYVDANEAREPVRSNAADARPTHAPRQLSESAPRQTAPPAAPAPVAPQTASAAPLAASAAVQAASEMASAPTPQPDFSYLREVEDLRVPARVSESEQSAEPTDSFADNTRSEAPQAEDADVLYDEYDEDEGGGLFASRGMMVAAGVMAFVLLGGGALLAYQAIFSSDDGSPPPLVLADKNAVRMLPDGQAADPAASGDIPLTNESDLSNGVIQPGAETPIARINPNIDPDRTVRQIGANGNNSGTDAIAPRSVRTFKVNPDGSIVAEPAARVDNNSNAIQPRTVTTQQISGNGEVVAAPAESDGGTPLPRARPDVSTSTSNNAGGSTGIQPRIVANNNTATNNTGTSGRADLPVPPRVSVGTNAPAFNQNAPTVQPSTNSVAARVPSTDVTLAAPAAQPAAQPAAPAAVGDFVVQVSSQRSEDAARSAFSGLQRRFPSVLGNQSPDIARADLGSRGVFYRVRVGPMETRVAAADFCQSLKNAGGDCIVARR
ncbi:SPOR domain-containing protein [Pararhizobium sp. IMCC21322]|uniref:SPOR domain-containing protein n=1 Tax=Pararhizobium sp. IMCC21322 TaxID=3067903 RepID=UPI002740C269|nr:SPOR domain-containing protein [Pararhizobium sp. IMCC21322]